MRHIPAVLMGGLGCECSSGGWGRVMCQTSSQRSLAPENLRSAHPPGKSSQKYLSAQGALVANIAIFQEGVTWSRESTHAAKTSISERRMT